MSSSPGTDLFVAPLSSRGGERALGGKGWQLARMVELGLPVPPAFVVTTSALLTTIERQGLRPVCHSAAAALASGDGDRARAAGRAAAAALERVPLPEEVAHALSAAVASLASQPTHAPSGTLGAPLFAVRSSAVGEDAAGRSHAGQFESVLNLSAGGVADAVREVWASWYSDRAIGYRLGTARETEPRPPGAVIPPMAVVVQRMVVPRASGMLFTVDPVTGNPHEMTLEAGPGLGEALAQGRILPDFFRLHRSGRPGGKPRISERGVADKDRRMAPEPPGSGRLEFRPIPPHERRKPCVSDAEIDAICALGLRCEEELGGPVDVEWTIDTSGNVHLVQARPVTAVPTWRADKRALRDRPVLWTQRFSGERWTEQATPLGWSIVQPVLHHFTYWERAADRYLDGTPPTRLYRGRPYFNVTIFRHLACRLPGQTPPAFLLEMFPASEQEELKRGPLFPNLGLVGSVLTQVVVEQRWKRYRFNVLTNHREWEDFRAGFEARAAALRLDFGTAAEGLEIVEDARRLMVEYMSLHLLSLLFAHLSYELLDQALRSWVGLEGEAIRSALVADPTENRTLQTNKALWELAGAARRLPDVAAMLLADPLPELEELQAAPGGERFVAEFEEFVRRFGHRSQASYEIFATRWADSPELVLRMVAGYLRAPEGDSPADRESRRMRERAQAERLVRQRMSRTWSRRLLPWRQALFGELLDLTRRYVALRENQRFSFDRLLLRLKRAFERIGALLERDGVLERGESIVFLAIDELRALVAGRLTRADGVGLIDARRAEFEANRQLDHPDFLIADGAEAFDEVRGDARGLHGLGISPGVATGPVRVLRSFEEMGRLQPGEVLVARATDPGWTPLFLSASALVLELGSVLSHGAVVAREYGLPAVVNVEGATRLLQDGDVVTVDGGRGLVVLHRAAKGPDGTARDLM